jgi:hypothetical protein
MKKLIGSLLIMLTITCSLHVKAAELSDNSKVYILTVLPGKEIYTVFGHSAIRVYDPVNEIDRVYNYGTFDFDTPFFYLKFIKGNLIYQLAWSEYEQEQAQWPYEQRTVYEQELNISQKDKQNIYDNLENTYHSKSRYYRYDFFFDNCATRIRDIVEKSLEGRLIYDTTGYSGKSFRELIYPYIRLNYWLDAGINTALGQKTDRTADTKEYMFLPEFIMQIYANARLTEHTDTVKFTSPPKIIFEGSIKPGTKKGYGQYIPWLVFVFIFLLIFYEIFKKKFYRFPDAIILFIYGLTGSVLLFFWLYSLHAVLHNNFNIIWLFPLNLPAAFMLWKNKWAKLIYYYSLIVASCIFLFLVLQPFIPQKLTIELLPLVLIVFISLVRNILHYMFRKII